MFHFKFIFLRKTRKSAKTLFSSKLIFFSYELILQCPTVGMLSKSKYFAISNANPLFQKFNHWEVFIVVVGECMIIKLRLEGITRLYFVILNVKLIITRNKIRAQIPAKTCKIRIRIWKLQEPLPVVGNCG